VDHKPCGVRIGIKLRVSDDGQSGEVYFILKIDLILTGTSVDFLKRLRTPALHLGKTLDDFIGMTAQHPGLGLSVDKELIHQMPSRMLLNMVTHDGVVGLADQGHHNTSFTGLRL